MLTFHAVNAQRVTPIDHAKIGCFLRAPSQAPKWNLALFAQVHIALHQGPQLEEEQSEPILAGAFILLYKTIDLERPQQAV
jgi:hypothetical protein